MTCWRRLRDWTEAGVWPTVKELVLAEVRAAGTLDLDRCAVDGSHVRALKGRTVGPSPVDRGRHGPKHAAAMCEWSRPADRFPRNHASSNTAYGNSAYGNEY